MVGMSFIPSLGSWLAWGGSLLVSVKLRNVSLLIFGKQLDGSISPRTFWVFWWTGNLSEAKKPYLSDIILLAVYLILLMLFLSLHCSCVCLGWVFAFSHFLLWEQWKKHCHGLWDNLVFLTWLGRLAACNPNLCCCSVAVVSMSPVGLDLGQWGWGSYIHMEWHLKWRYMMRKTVYKGQKLFPSARSLVAQW